MTERDLSILRDESAMSAELRAKVDAELAAPAGEAIRRLVAELPSEEPSLAWRSQLNERLRAEAPGQRRRPIFAWAMSGSLAAACALGVLMFVSQRHAPIAPAPVDEEAKLLAAYHESTSVLEISATEPGAARAAGSADEMTNSWALEDLQDM